LLTLPTGVLTSRNVAIPTLPSPLLPRRIFVGVTTVGVREPFSLAGPGPGGVLRGGVQVRAPDAVSHFGGAGFGYVGVLGLSRSRSRRCGGGALDDGDGWDEDGDGSAVLWYDVGCDVVAGAVRGSFSVCGYERGSLRLDVVRGLFHRGRDGVRVRRGDFVFGVAESAAVWSIYGDVIGGIVRVGFSEVFGGFVVLV